MGTPLSENLLIVGRIVRTHGLKGECKVVPESDDPNRLQSLKRIWLGATPQTAELYEITGTRLQTSKRGTIVLMQFSGIHTVSDAERLGKPLVFAYQEDLPPLQPGEFFLHDLFGIEVVTEEGEIVGKLKDVWETQNYPLYLIERPGNKEIFIPAVPSLIVSTHIEQKRLVVRAVEGLLE
ncbi:MAG: ribosome maturation factor RimM [Bacteroidetes bacterium]|nr:ribosome maturation factor RimM [Bacteroidota bacterium]